MTTWAMIWPNVDNIPRHPSPIYQMLVDGILLFIILWIFARHSRPRMAVAGMFSLLYGCARFFTEWFRVPDWETTVMGLPITSGQVLSLPMIVAALAIVSFYTSISGIVKAEMFPPERRARGMSLVLFGAVSGAIFGPLVFGPLFATRDLTPDDLAVPWLGSALFALAGLLISFGVRVDRRPERPVLRHEPVDQVHVHRLGGRLCRARQERLVCRAEAPRMGRLHRLHARGRRAR